MRPSRLLRAAACAALCALATAPMMLAGPAQAHPAPHHAGHPKAGLPVHAIEHILQADGHVSHGVLEVDINRSDLKVKGPGGVPFADGFQIQHELYFQSLGRHQAILNGDLALRPDEIQRVIDTLIAHHLVFQAEHQHLYDLHPMVWFVHFRGTGDPLRLARAIHDTITTTRTPLPQHSPAHPTTPLPVQRLARILGGDATVGDNGVVTVTVDRADTIILGGKKISPDLGVSTEVQFEPLPGGKAAVVPDFSMTAQEVQPVVAVMRFQHWLVGCLYNQETDEHPQLYFSHMFRTGDPVALAREVREGLERTRVGDPH